MQKQTALHLSDSFSCMFFFLQTHLTLCIKKTDLNSVRAGLVKAWGAASYRDWLWSRLGHSPHTAKLKQLQREGRTSSPPPYPSCAADFFWILVILFIYLYIYFFPQRCLRLSRRSAADSVTLLPLLLLLKRKPACAALAALSLFLFQRAPRCALLPNALVLNRSPPPK